MDTTNLTLTEQEALGFALVGSVVTLVLIIIAIVGFIVSAIGFYKMFKKAGSAGWKAYIPFVSAYEKFRLSWNVKYFWLWFAATAASSILFYCAEMLAGGTALAFLPDAIACIFSIVALGYSLKMNRLLAQAYGYGKVCGVCLWLFPFITSLVVGFGSSRYTDNRYLS